MNKTRRAQLARIDQRICEIKRDVKDVLWDERDSLRSIPENFEGTERYSKIEDAVDALEDVVFHIDEAVTYLHNAMQ